MNLQYILLKVFRDITPIISGTFLARLLTFLISLIVARVGGAQTFGEYTLFLSIFAITATVGEYFDTTFIRVANTPAAKNQQNRLHAAHIVAKLLYAIAVTCGAWATAPLLAQRVFQKPDSAALITLAALAGGLASLYVATIGFYRLRQEFRKVAMLLPVLNAILLLAIGALAISKRTFNAELVFVTFVIVAAALATVSILRLATILVSIADPFSLRLTYFMRQAAPLVGGSIFALIANSLDVLFLTAYVTFADLGIYGVAARTATVLAILGTAFRIFLEPKAAQAVRDARHKREFMTMSGVLLTLYTGAIAVFALLIEQFIAVFFGAQYEAANTIAIALIVKTSLEIYAIPLIATIQCGPRPVDIVYLSLFRLTVAAALLATLVPAFGVVGAAYAVVGASAAGLAASGLFVVLHARRAGAMKTKK